MFRISKLTDYALLILSHMAKSPQHVLSASELAENLHLNTPTVSKILKMVSEKNLVHSVRGSVGGYHLARSPETITVADVIAAMEKPGITACTQASKPCVLDARCMLRTNWHQINTMVYDLLASFTLLDMLKPIQRSV